MISIFNRLFIRGLIIVLPVTLTLALIIWLVSRLEGVFAYLIKSVVGPNLYLPGAGILLSIFIILIVGSLVSNYLTERFVTFFVSRFEKIPLVKTIYNPLKDLISLFGNQSNSMNMQRVVLVDIWSNGVQVVGLVTRDSFEDIPTISGFTNEKIAVYFPLSYMFGGYTLLVPKDRVEEVDLPVDRALKLAITGWIHVKNSEKEHKDESNR
jgi:uncharacterized membrane protein